MILKLKYGFLLTSGLIMGTAFYSPVHAASQEEALQLSGNSELCLTLKGNKADVGMQQCDASVSQRWHYVRSGDKFYIKNRAVPDSRCLRAFSKTVIKMDDCFGSGFTSSRLWEMITKDDSVYAIRNKYINDTGNTRNYLYVENNKLSFNKNNAGEIPLWYRELPLPAIKLNAVKGDKKVLLLITHYEGYKPASTEKVKQAVFGMEDNYTSLRQHVSLSSRGQLRLSGDTFDNINLGPKPDHCTTSTIRSLIAQKAKERGIDMSQYDYIFTELTANEKCNYVGLAATPGNWILANASGHKYWMWAHEFGHNLGYKHIKAVKNCAVEGTTVQLNTSCTVTDKDAHDITDTMGGGGQHLYPANYQFLSGWLKESQVPYAKKEKATYLLTPLFGDAEGLKALRILRKDGSYLILEYRQPMEGYENWAEDSPVVNGVTIRIYSVGGGTVLNKIVDATPGSRKLSEDTKDAQLTAGTSLYDELSGKLIQVDMVSPEGATVTVTPVKAN